MRKLTVIVLLISLFIVLGSHTLFAQEENISTEGAIQWYKGNTHTHTLNSDGDSSPGDVVKWYHEHAYHFLFLTDHDYLTNVDTLNEKYQDDENFIVIQGDEVSDEFEEKPIHVNGLDVKRLVMPQGGSSVVETIQNVVNAIREAGGIPQIDHPNYKRALTAEDIKMVENCILLEISNGHPRTNDLGGIDIPGMEQMWDDILSGGKLIYGVASDDTHSLKGLWSRKGALPGHGWVCVRASELTSDEIVAAMERGDFYSSTGIELKDYQVDDTGITITINEEPPKYMVEYQTIFIGKNGDELKRTNENPAQYNFNGDEMYVRAKIIDSNGNRAWTQPLMLKSY